MNDPHPPLNSNHFLSRREFIVWIIAIGITIILGFLSRGTQWAGDVGEFVSTINVIASMFALGLPIFLLMGLMFASPTSRQHLQQLSSQGASDWRLLLFRFVQCLVLVGIYSIVTTITIFIEPIITATYLDYSISLGYFVYLPSVLIASLIVGCVLAALAILLTMATDRVYLSASLGSTITIFLALVAGWNQSILSYSVTRNLALASPHNLFKMLAAVLSGHDFSISANDMMYFGFSVSPESLLVPLIGYTLLASVTIVLSLPILRVNMARWSVLGMVATSTIWESSTAQHNPSVAINAKKKLRFQRTAAVFFVCTLIISFGMGNFVITQNIEDSSRITHYLSPEGGQSINLGDWLVIEFYMPPPYPDLSNIVNYGISIIDWGSCPDELSYTNAFLMMGQNEFDQLNESSKLELCREPRNETKGEWGGVSGYRNLGDEFGIHILVFYVYATTNSTFSGSLQISIDIRQRSG